MSPDLARIKAALERHKHLMDLDRDGLGEALCKAFTDGVQENIAGEHAPDGSAWPALSPDYAEWKAFHYPGSPIGVREGTMANPREVAGTVEAPTPTRAAVTYGVGDRARAEYAWFSEGDPAANRPPRPSWGFTADSLREIERILTERLKTA